jgi:hypothetical protein
METQKIPSAIGYAATRDGQIISYHRLEPFALKDAAHPQGYRKVQVKTAEGIKNRLVHRLVLEAWVGPCPEGCVTNHKNGNKADNRLENLEYCTQSQNMAHSYANGLSPKPPIMYGEQINRAVLTAQQVLEMRAETDREEGYTHRMAAKYGVTPATVSKVLLRRTWKHV